MTRRDQARRDLQIAAEAALGSTQADLAARYDVSDRTIRRALQRVGRSSARPSIERLGERWRQIDSAVDQAAQVRMTATDPATTLAAIRTQIELSGERLSLLRLLGLAPTGASPSLRSLSDSLLDAAEADGLSTEFQAWLRDATARLLRG